ncbi:MAG: hypothetical protein LAT77_03710 [Aliidiomarina sp.]|uniref:hypothetical protein n=1 Tax=Aliidiomarina sp. TaxID=1872439 RepID=UPI0025C225AD|nr:hypothetical protein [Aliidiomarina sp.]MCH8501004.1 hypothetical protein [Aliidiomarina sp.]
MKKNIVIVVIILAITGYIAGILTTKKLAEEQLPRLIEEFSEYHEFEVNVEWLAQGWRSGKVRISGNAELDNSTRILFSENVDLTYGFLSARWIGQGESRIDALLAEGMTPYTYSSQGRVSRGGLFLDYQGDAYNQVWNDWSLELGVVHAQLAMVGSKILMDWQVSHAFYGLGENEGVAARDVKVHWGTQTRNGVAEVVDLRSHVGQFGMTFGQDAESFNWHGEDIGYSFFMDATREDASIYGSSNANFIWSDSPTTVTVDWRLNGVKSADVLVLQRFLIDRDFSELDDEAWANLAAFVSVDPELVVERFVGESEQLGKLELHGSMTFLTERWAEMMDSLDNHRNVPFNATLGLMNLDVTVTELPAMGQMLLLALPEDAQSMPLRIILKDGEFSANGHPVD